MILNEKGVLFYTPNNSLFSSLITVYAKVLLTSPIWKSCSSKKNKHGVGGDIRGNQVYTLLQVSHFLVVSHCLYFSGLSMFFFFLT